MTLTRQAKRFILWPQFINTALPRIYNTVVSPGGLVAIDGVLYQVPPELVNQEIFIDLDRMEFFTTTPPQHPLSPYFKKLKPGSPRPEQREAA